MEVWRDIPGYEGLYQISDMGRVKSMPRLVVRSITNGNYTVKERFLRPALADGYPIVGLSKNGKPRTWRVHFLVMMAFVGPRPDGADVCHEDGDRVNNALSNLRYASRRENMADAIKHGTMAGVKNGNSKLSAKQIMAIVDAYNELEEKLASEHGVSVGTIRNLKMGRTYKGNR